MTTDLTEIDGVGPSYAEELSEAGYESAEDVAEADEDELDKLIGTINGSDLRASATDLVGDQGQSDGQEQSVDDDTVEFDMDLSTDQRNHLIKALVNEEIRARKTNSKSEVESAKEAIEMVIEGEPPYQFTRQQLDAGYRSTNQLESEYRSQRGVGSFTTQIRHLNQAFQQARKEHQQRNE